MKIILPSLPAHYTTGTRSSRNFFLTVIFSLLSLAGFSQTDGDYRSVSDGDWDDPTTWEFYSGGSWGAATNYPGEAAISTNVTVQAGDSVLLNTSPTFNIENLFVYGQITAVTTDRTIEVDEVYIYEPEGHIYMDGNVSITIPENSFISYTPGYNGISGVGTPCSNNTALFVGSVKYSACNGGGNVCVIFTEMNDAGGTVHVVPNIELELDAEQGGTDLSCVKTFNAKISILGVLTGSEVTISLTGIAPGGETIDLTPDNFGPIDTATGGIITVTTGVVVSNPGNYTIVANVDLNYDAGCNTPLVISSEADIDFTVLAPIDVSINAPTGVCLNSMETLDITNNSLTTAVSVTLNIDNGTPLVAPVPANSTVNYLLPTSVATSFTINVTKYQYAAPPPCTVNLTDMYMVTVGDATTLAIDGDATIQDVTVSPTVVADQGCRLIATVNDLGTVTEVGAVAYVAGDVIEYSGRPLVGRRILLHPTANSNPGGAALITLYAYQSEFTAFNNSPINNIDLPHDGTDAEGYASNIRVIKFEEGDYDEVTGMPTGNVQATATELVPTNVTYNATRDWWEITVSVNEYSLFIISNPTFVLLPLKLVEFDATLSGKRTAALRWKTTDERNVQSFDVEASRDGRLFSKVGEVKAYNSVTGGNYSFNTAMPGKLGYFRLKMIDKNGAYSYSPIKSLRTDELIITSYPNPVKDQMIVDLTGYPAGTMRIVDMNGRTLSTYKTVDGINRINTSALGTGLYILQVSVGLETEKMKFTKVQR